MADDNTFQAQRSNDLNLRTAEPRLSAETDDPLAELARLIGKSESFTQFTRNNARREQVAQAAPSLAPDNWQYPARSEQVPSAGSHDPYGSAQDFDASTTHGGGDLSAETGDQAHWAADQQQYASEPGDAPDEHGTPEVYVHDEAPLEPHEDAMYDDPPRVQRRSGLTTALVLIGCAMLGTAGAYAYRSYFGNARAMQPPPVIAADSSTPIKIVPATTGDPQAGKAVQNRVADAGKEQLVSKQEEPVSLKQPGGQAAPAPLAPMPAPPTATGTPVPAPLAAGTPVPTPQATGIKVPTPQAATGAPVPAAPVATAAPAPQPAGVPTASASNEPKKVRTVTIRPDAGDASGRPQVALAPGAGTASRSPAGTPAGRAPLSLDAQSADPAAAPPTRTRTATAPAQPQAAPEAPTSRFVVQLSSQKSESEAQASFRSLQAKFPNELGGRHPIIRRVDLGNKGVFYRTMVGPFASAHEASQFCANYKASGGQCMVPNN